jgi:tripartite motif-containing protein 71
LWVADRDQHQLIVYRPDGDLDFKFGTRGSAVGQFFRPTAVSFDAVNDRFLVADKDNHRIQIFNTRGEFLFLFGCKGSRPGQFLFPWGIAVSPDGHHIAVADTRNHRIQLFDGCGNFLRQFRVSDGHNWKDFRQIFDYPRGIAFNASGK